MPENLQGLDLFLDNSQIKMYGHMALEYGSNVLHLYTFMPHFSLWIFTNSIPSHPL
jgi:hypothetical protein